MALKEGEKAPHFVALDQNGKKHQLSDYKGKWLLLYFYPKDNTPGCTKEACSFRDQFHDLKGKVEVLGVSHDGLESHQRFAEKYKLPFLMKIFDDKNQTITWTNKSDALHHMILDEECLHIIEEFMNENNLFLKYNITHKK